MTETWKEMVFELHILLFFVSLKGGHHVAAKSCCLKEYFGRRHLLYGHSQEQLSKAFHPNINEIISSNTLI